MKSNKQLESHDKYYSNANFALFNVPSQSDFAPSVYRLPTNQMRMRFEHFTD